MLSFAIKVIDSKVAVTIMDVAILFSWISLNSLIPLVKAEKSKNTQALISTAKPKPMPRYNPEY